MTAYYHLINSEFHDTSLVGISRNGSTLILKIEYYDDDDNEQSVNVPIVGVGAILRGGVSVDTIAMETNHGSIIRLAQENQDVKLMLDWVDFSSQSRTPCLYKILGAKIQ